MKKTLCTILAAVLAASTLVSCSAYRDASASSSSDAGDSKYAAFLADRGVTPPSLTVVKSDGETKYGVDMADFEDDGYFIRAEDGEVALVAKTDEGLDRAVRRYANYGNPDDYEYTYHEGYRVKKLTVCGTDISAFCVVKDDDADECQSFAADELVKYIEKACGAKLAIFTASEYGALSEKPLAVRLAVDYPALGDEAFRITVSESGIRIDGGRYRGCMYGVYDLLEDIGWRFVEGPVSTRASSGKDTLVDYLYEAESIDLTSALDREEHSLIAFRNLNSVSSPANNGNIAAKYRVMNGTLYAKYGTYGLIGTTCHGINNYKSVLKSNGLWIGGQPCYSDPDVIEVVQDEIRKNIDGRLAAGQQIGKEIMNFDVGHDDNSDFCRCPRCQKIIKEEGALSAITLRFANAIAKMLSEEYPGTGVSTFGYNDTVVPPAKERPLPNVRVAYCFYIGHNVIVCSAHDATGLDAPSNCPNCKFGAGFEKWAEICTNNNLEIWYYPLHAFGVAFGAPIITAEYDSLRSLFTGEHKISSMMVDGGYGNGVNLETLAVYLCSRMLWDAETMTRDDYNALIQEWFDIFYGDAAEYMLEYFRQIELAGQTNGCWVSFHGPKYKTVNNEYVADHFDDWWELYKAAKLACASEKEEELVERYMAGMMYICIGITHDDRYTNGTEEQRAVIAERYTEMHRLFRKYNLKTYNDFIDVEYAPEELDLNTNPFEAFMPIKKYDVMK